MKMIIEHLTESDLMITLEEQETEYWSDHYKNVPADIADNIGIDLVKTGNATAMIASNSDILALNRVTGLGLTQPATDDQIEQLINLYRESGATRFFIQLSPIAQPEYLPKILLSKGFYHHNNWVKLYREIQPIPFGKSRLEIRQINSQDALLFADIVLTAFNWPKRLRPMLALPVNQNGWKHYLAYKNGIPIACAALFTRGKYASLALAATLPEYRGLGAQSSLIARRFEDAEREGCKWMFTETAEETPERRVDSYRNMLRYGFDVANTRPNYLLNL